MPENEADNQDDVDNVSSEPANPTSEIRGHAGRRDPETSAEEDKTCPFDDTNAVVRAVKPAIEQQVGKATQKQEFEVLGGFDVGEDEISFGVQSDSKDANDAPDNLD